VAAADKVERRVIDGIRSKLLSPEAIPAAVRAHRQAQAIQR
jgi:hypothetical protein